MPFKTHFVRQFAAAAAVPPQLNDDDEHISFSSSDEVDVPQSKTGKKRKLGSKGKQKAKSLSDRKQKIKCVTVDSGESYDDYTSSSSDSEANDVIRVEQKKRGKKKQSSRSLSKGHRVDKRGRHSDTESEDERPKFTPLPKNAALRSKVVSGEGLIDKINQIGKRLLNNNVRAVNALTEDSMVTLKSVCDGLMKNVLPDSADGIKSQFHMELKTMLDPSSSIIQLKDVLLGTPFRKSLSRYMTDLYMPPESSKNKKAGYQDSEEENF